MIRATIASPMAGAFKNSSLPVAGRLKYSKPACPSIAGSNPAAICLSQKNRRLSSAHPSSRFRSPPVFFFSREFSAHSQLSFGEKLCRTSPWVEPRLSGSVPTFHTILPAPALPLAGHSVIVPLSSNGFSEMYFVLHGLSGRYSRQTAGDSSTSPDIFCVRPLAGFDADSVFAFGGGVSGP